MCYDGWHSRGVLSDLFSTDTRRRVALWPICLDLDIRPKMFLFGVGIKPVR